MIRINLLGTPKPKKGKRSAVPLAGGGEGPGVVLIVLVILLLTAAVNGAYYLKLTRDSAQLQKQITAANLEYARLTQVKLRYEELEKQKDAYKTRVDVIDQLHAQQSGPLNLLTTIGNTVDHTDEVWLNTMLDSGNSITLKGEALSVDSVANLMHNLQSTGFFQTVEIKSAYQDEAVKDMRAFVFELDCGKRAAAPPTAAPPAARKS